MLKNLPTPNKRTKKIEKNMENNKIDMKKTWIISNKIMDI